LETGSLSIVRWKGGRHLYSIPTLCAQCAKNTFTYDS
jgi:hypothetical protein